MNKAYLVLENGMVFEGFAMGAEGAAIGELVFNTGVCGYTDTLTNPSNAGQIVMQTFPLIGNYGLIASDFQGECALNGYVVREWCAIPSNFRAEKDLDTFLKEKGVVGIYGVDTRQITKVLREEGSMNVMICKKIPEDLTSVKEYKIIGAVSEVSCTEPQVFGPKGKVVSRVVLIDYGTRKSFIDELVSRGCQVTVVPQDTTAEVILQMNPNGVLLSNGPANQKEKNNCIFEIRKLFGKLPIFGIGLGHQMLALAAGGETVKMGHGHRGANQPVKSLEDGRTYITIQNHGYVVDAESVKDLANVNYINANDSTCEGLSYPTKRAFSVQFYPESFSGPRHTGFLFDRFITMMGGAL